MQRVPLAQYSGAKSRRLAVERGRRAHGAGRRLVDGASRELGLRRLGLIDSGWRVRALGFFGIGVAGLIVAEVANIAFDASCTRSFLGTTCQRVWYEPKKRHARARARAGLPGSRVDSAGRQR